MVGPAKTRLGHPKLRTPKVDATKGLGERRTLSHWHHSMGVRRMGVPVPPCSPSCPNPPVAPPLRLTLRRLLPLELAGVPARPRGLARLGSAALPPAPTPPALTLCPRAALGAAPSPAGGVVSGMADPGRPPGLPLAGEPPVPADTVYPKGEPADRGPALPTARWEVAR
jgi:hypothetical protein